MRKVFYYTPIIKTIASNGSERLGAQAITKMWTDKLPEMKIEVNQAGKTIEDAHQKLLTFLSSGGESETIELQSEYYLCSKSVVEKFKPFEVSKPFKSGYEFEKESDYYVAWLNFEEVEKYYKEHVEDKDEQESFFCRECVPGQMNDSKVSVNSARKKGLMVEIENKLGLTAERNIAMTIYNMAANRGLSPVELINYIHKN